MSLKITWANIDVRLLPQWGSILVLAASPIWYSWLESKGAYVSKNEQLLASFFFISVLSWIFLHMTGFKSCFRKCVLENGNIWSLFSLLLTVNSNYVHYHFFAKDWTQTKNLWNLKRPLCQLSQNHCLCHNSVQDIWKGAFTHCVYSLRLLVAFEKKLNKRFFSDFGFLPDSPRLEISILYWLDLSCWIDCDQCDQIL